MHYILANTLLMLLLPMKKARPGLVIAVSIMMCIFTIVYMNGSADYKGYLTYFSCSQNRFCLNSGELNFELSYVVISNLFFALFYKSGGAWVIAFYSSIALVIKLFMIRENAKHFGIALMCYATYAWYVHEMTQIRIGLAIALYWLAVLYYTKKHNLLSVLFFTSAVFFHMSVMIGAIFFVFPYVKVSSRRFFYFCLATSAVGLLVSGSPAFLSLIFSFGFVDSRIAVYSEAIGNIVSSTNYLTVYFVASVIGLFAYAQTVSDEDASEFEIYGFRLGCFGMLYYSFFYWIPTVGLRGLEFFLCFAPFFIAATYRLSKGYFFKWVIVGCAVLVFYNLLVRNGTRVDFVLPGQAQELWME